MNPAGVHEQVQKLISAYIDRELTQGESQFVEVHAADCAECSGVLRETAALRELTAGLRFPPAPDERFDELGRSLSVQAPRSAGWLLIVAGLIAWIGWVGVLAFRNMRLPSPQEAIAGMLFAGVVLLFVSVVRQRATEYPHDRYRRVKR